MVDNKYLVVVLYSSYFFFLAVVHYRFLFFFLFGFCPLPLHENDAFPSSMVGWCLSFVRCTIFFEEFS